MRNWLRKFKKAGVLNINMRNLSFVMEYNRRRDYPNADDKLITKRLAQEADIQVPSLYGVIEFTGQIKSLGEMLEGRETFVIKPCHGSGGEGVVVVTGRDGDDFVRGKSGTISLPELRHHVANILHGLFSLGGRPDSAMIEERVDFDPLFENISYRGVPDVRLIVFKGTPVMAMLRLPTSASGGRANLHQGAIGVGIDIRSGITTFAVSGSSEVDCHPDTGVKISGVQLPQWKRLLEIGRACYQFSNLGYLGVDIVYDRLKGPMLLEINARPGLSIQLANRLGLLKVLEQAAASSQSAA